MEGFWSLLRSWLRPHRGISQEKLPLYLGFFEFVHNVRKRGKALLHVLIELLLDSCVLPRWTERSQCWDFLLFRTDRGADFRSGLPSLP